MKRLLYTLVFSICLGPVCAIMAVIFVALDYWRLAVTAMLVTSFLVGYFLGVLACVAVRHSNALNAHLPDETRRHR